MGMKLTSTRVYAAVVILMVVLAGPAMAQEAGDGEDSPDRGMPGGALLAVSVALGGVALIALLIAAWQFGGSRSSIHGMRRRYFETCRQRRRQSAVHAGTKNGVPGP